MSNCCARLVDDGWPIAVHCFPPPIDPSKDEELEGTVETPPLLFTCRKDDGVDDEEEEELAVDAKCR